MRDRFDSRLDTPIPFGLSPELQRRADELGVAVDRRPYEPPAIVAEHPLDDDGALLSWDPSRIPTRGGAR